MFSQEVGESLYLVIRENDSYNVQERVVWGTKDTETDWAGQNWLVLVRPGEEYEKRPDDAVVFQHGKGLPNVAGTFEDRDMAYSVCEYLNGY